MFDNITQECNTNPVLLNIAASNDFYFQKGQDAINKWLKLDLSDTQKTKIIDLSGDYDVLKNIDQTQTDIYPIIQLLLQIISYCDIHASGKRQLNQYPDHRTIANAGVRMGAWVKNLVEYRFNPQNVSGSIKNAFDYLLNPADHLTVLSENHRREIIGHYFNKDYNPASFTEELKSLFGNYELSVLNRDNYTHYITRLIYFYNHEWKPKANLTLKQLIEKLRDHFHNEKVVLKILEWKPRQKYVWIADKDDIIGNATAHYEVSFRGISGNRSDIYIDIHFENSKKANKEIFFNTIQSLPENLEWIDWQYSKSIGYKERYNLDDEDIVAKVTAALEYMEDNIGDQIRQIIGNLPPEIHNQNPTDNPAEMKHCLNQILYGPPGTGKTYNTINKALEIINDVEVQTLDWNDRAQVKKLFDKKVKENQIVFTTFHQNMSYEDFIEGIKPRKSDENNVYYEIEDGVFKTICETAKNNNNSNIVRSQNSLLTANDFEIRNFFKISLGEAKNPNDRDIYDYCIENNVIAIGYGGLTDFTDLSTKVINQKWKETHPDDATTPSYMNYFIHKIKIGDYIIVSNGNSTLRAIAKVKGNYSFLEDSPIRYHHFREVEWLFYNNDINVFDVYNLQFSQSTLYSLKKKELKKSFFTEKTNQADITSSVQKNFVIVIDEINRGNVSKIFGELITLIEESKRIGKTEAITAKLPYSKEEFSVPDNVYILGTMNTADRSVEALDTALRRRFDFIEMMPKYDLIEAAEREKYRLNDYDAFDILKTINDRLEVLLGRDHLIGHSFFLLDEHETIEPKVKSAFYKNIIPLLQEYFYGDYNKIGLILGSGFVKKNDVPKAALLFADTKEFGGNDYVNDNTYTFEIIDYTNTNLFPSNAGFYAALNTLMNKPIESEADA
jgi:5-methylcytosine-specific restriction enzyme B